MWDAAEIDLSEVDNDFVIMTVRCPAGNLKLAGVVTLADRVLYVVDAQVEGLRPGALGRAGLNAIAHKIYGVCRCRRNPHSRRHSNDRAQPGTQSASRTKVILARHAPIDRPISVIEELGRAGLRLKSAHAIVEALAQGIEVDASVETSRYVSLASSLDKLGISATVLVAADARDAAPERQCETRSPEHRDSGEQPKATPVDSTGPGEASR